jgi:hypothetical protein
MKSLFTKKQQCVARLTPWASGLVVVTSERGEEKREKRRYRDESCGGWKSVYDQFTAACFPVLHFISFDFLLLI